MGKEQGKYMLFPRGDRHRDSVVWPPQAAPGVGAGGTVTAPCWSGRELRLHPQPSATEADHRQGGPRPGGAPASVTAPAHRCKASTQEECVQGAPRAQHPVRRGRRIY